MLEGTDISTSFGGSLVTNGTAVAPVSIVGLYVPPANCSVDIDAGTTFINNALGDMN